MQVYHDFRYALRQLRKSPAFTITVITTLGLCVGVNAAIFSLVDTLFFRPLPYPNPDRLVLVCSRFRRGTASGLSPNQDGSQWEAVRDRASLIDAAVYGSTEGVNLYSRGRVEYILEQRVSANFFHVLGVEPLLGREFTREEDVPGGPSLVVLSYGLWQRVFHGDPAVIGRPIDLRGAPYTVAGVMPKGFRTDTAAEVWTPLRPSRSGEGGGTNYAVIGRLKPGVTLASASAQLNVAMQPVFAGRHLPPDLHAEEQALPLQVGLTTELRSPVELMWSAAGLVLLIGCVNIAGLLLARSATRSREVATRLALGASKVRVVWALLVESLVLGAGGGALGVFVGYFALQALTRLNPSEFDFWGPVHMDFRVVLVMLGAALVTGVLFGVFPAWDVSSVDVRAALVEGGRSATAGRRLWKRQMLVFAEIALGVSLVVSAGLLIRTFAWFMNQNPGFDSTNVTTASLSLADARYSTSEAGARLFQKTIDRIEQIPGVESAAFSLSLPYQTPLNDQVMIPGRDLGPYGGITNFIYVTPGYFFTLRIHLLRGRDFRTADDLPSAEPVAIVNRKFVQSYLKSSEPVGASIHLEGKSYRIIGVIADTRESSEHIGGHFGPLDALPDVYVPVSQFGPGFAQANIWLSPNCVVRTHGDIQGLPQAMQVALAAVDPRLPFSSFKKMSEVRADALQSQRYRAVLFSTLAGLAILLAAVGVYGMVAQSVVQRTREMGIRLALGAGAANIVRSAAAPGILTSIAGVAAGIAIAVFATRMLNAVLWGVRPYDPATFIAVALLLVAIAAAASLIPSLRLLRLDPARTLRED